MGPLTLVFENYKGEGKEGEKEEVLWAYLRKRMSNCQLSNLIEKDKMFPAVNQNRMDFCLFVCVCFIFLSAFAKYF